MITRLPKRLHLRAIVKMERAVQLKKKTTTNNNKRSQEWPRFTGVVYRKAKLLYQPREDTHDS